MINLIIDAIEKRLGVRVDYLREMAAASRSAFFKLMLFMPMAGHRSGLDAASVHVAGLTAVLHQDCGPCAQIAINEALRDDVPVEYLQAIIHGTPERLPQGLQDVHRFAQAVVERRDEASEWRDRIRERLGSEAVVTLSMMIASAQVFPLVKRGMGHDVSCRLVSFDFGPSDDEAVRREPQEEALV